MDDISFGPFCLVLSKRLLTREGEPVELGARAIDTLIALITRPNEFVSKHELLAEIWPDVIVSEGSLRFQINGLRKALGDGQDGARYIVTSPGRGYCFVGEISALPRQAERAEPEIAPLGRAADFPAKLERMIGRTDELATLTARLPAARFVTIVGSGGVGKTTLAIAVAHSLLKNFDGSGLFLDLGMIKEPSIVPILLASMLNITVRSDDPVPNLITYLRDKRFLLILDNCEHVVEAAASLAERIFLASPHAYILTTSREPLRVEGEHVFRLTPLALPPDTPGLTATAALTFPATRLFYERAAASGADLDHGDQNAAIVARICRKLDGVALAIELAAGRVEAYGLEQTAELLDESLALLWHGQRTAPPRQQTMQATLDWSYHLLSERERSVLRRLAVFVGHFTLQAALSVVSSDTVDEPLVINVIASLVAKSMVTARVLGSITQYRLLYATRCYALEIESGTPEINMIAARHAEFYCDRMRNAGSVGSFPNSNFDRALLLAEMNDVRSALEWCFSPAGDSKIGVALATTAAPVFLSFSLLTECHRWLERALAVSDGNIGAAGQEMRLQAALGLSLMLTGGNNDAALAALERGLLIAEEARDMIGEVELLGLLHTYHHRVGAYAIALDYAKRSCAVAKSTGNPASLTLSNGILGISLVRVGDLDGARAALEAAIQHTPGTHMGAIFPRFDPYLWLGAPLAKTLWLLGYPEGAIARASETVIEATRVDRPVSLAIALKGAVPIFLWAGDLQSAEEYTDRLISHARFHSLGPYASVGNGYRAELAIRQGDPERGVASLRSCIEELNAARYVLHTTTFQIACAQGLTTLGRFEEALDLIDETARSVESNGDLSLMPEVLRGKGNLLLKQPQPDVIAGENLLKLSLDLSRRQGARAWELRATVDLAALWARKGRPEAARAILQPVLSHFEMGRATEDARAAARLLEALG